jgi:hypothetical protein
MNFLQSLDRRTLLAADIRVDQHAPGVVQNGASWDTAWTDLQSALAIAQPNDRILIAEGTYKPTSSLDKTISFIIPDAVQLLGGFAGSGEADPDARDVNANVTLLSGDIGVAGSDTDNSNHVVTGTALSAATLIDGLTIAYGNATTAPTSNFGGGMYLTSGSPTINNCKFVSNRAQSGGAFYHAAGSPAFTNCAFTGNTGYWGGAIMAKVGTLQLTNCTFTANTGQYGGAVDTEQNGAILADQCTFEKNTSTYLGGGFYYQGYGSAPASQLNRCSFLANTSALNGGGAYLTAAGVTIVNSIFVGNSSQTGGGVQMSGGALINCTLAFNKSSSLADGLYIGQSGPGAVTNCIIWGDNSNNTSNSPGAPHTTITYSDVLGATNLGPTNINVNPYLVRSPSPGSDGTWGTVDDDYGNLHLEPAVFPMPRPIDGGLNAAVPAGITTDLAGKPRFIDYPGANAGVLVDMGAYEQQPILAVSSGAFSYQQGLSISMVFNAVIMGSSVSAGDLQLFNQGNQNNYFPTSGFAPGGQTRQATWILSNTLPDGNYVATLPAGSVNDTAGNPMPEAFSMPFFILSADANRDRIVDTQDFNALAANFGGSSKVFSQGNFDYDSGGNVDSMDFDLLVAQYGKRLAAPVGALAAAGSLFATIPCPIMEDSEFPLLA